MQMHLLCLLSTHEYIQFIAQYSLSVFHTAHSHKKDGLCILFYLVRSVIIGHLLLMKHFQPLDSLNVSLAKPKKITLTFLLLLFYSGLKLCLKANLCFVRIASATIKSESVHVKSLLTLYFIDPKVNLNGKVTYVLFFTS